MPIVTIDQLVRVVEPRSPDRRAIDFAAVQMRDDAHFGGIEGVSGG
jgi:hypothetical protein